MARTISAGYVGGIGLAEGDNPLTITSTGSISSTDAAALTTARTVDWVIGNAGTISAGGVTKASIGIQMNAGTAASAGGTIINELGGVISAGHYGINSAKAVTLTNAGVITATAALGNAVRFATGDVANTGGTIQGGRYGIYLIGAGTVANTGIIAGASRSGVSVGAASVVTNVGAAATITGATRGVYLYGSGAVTNAGSIGATGAAGVGVLLLGGGSADTQAGGRVSGRFGIQAKSPGQPDPELVGAGIQVQAGGTIINAAGGTISAHWIGAQVGSFNGTTANGGVVMNAGTITANDPGVSGAAVWFKGNGTISNAATGSIGGGPFGISGRAQHPAYR